MKRIIFLDFDGVLNSDRFLAGLPVGSPILSQIDPEAVARLNILVKETGSAVVISSSWRKVFDVETLQEILNEHGFVGKIEGVTPDLSASPATGKRRERGDEIAMWLEFDFAKGSKYVVLDDGGDMRAVRDHLVQTSPETGLLDEHIQLARRLLA